jgi:4-amino-4-deoxy-L-arabinose transferase-like glycosyltransferase
MEEPSADAGDASAEGASQARRRMPSSLRVTLDLVLLLVVCLCLFLPGFPAEAPANLREAGVVEATRHLLGAVSEPGVSPAAHAPIGLQWMQVAVVAAGGEGADAPLWLFRVPSLVGALVAVAAVYWMGFLLGGAGTGLIAGVLLAGALLTGGAARLATPDGLVLGCLVLGQAALFDACRSLGGSRPLSAAAFWSALGIGVLVGGPLVAVPFLLAVAAVAVAERSLSFVGRLYPAVGLAWALLLVLPWLLARWPAGGLAAFPGALSAEFSLPGGFAPEVPGVASLILAAGFWPGTAFLAAAAPWIARHAGDPAVRLPLAVLLPSWLVAELASGALPLALLPALAPAAVLAARAVTAGAFARSGVFSALILIPAGAIALTVGLNLGFVSFEGHADPGGLVFGVAGAALAMAAWHVGVRRQAARSALALALLAAALLQFAFWQILLPRADGFSAFVP